MKQQEKFTMNEVNKIIFRRGDYKTLEEFYDIIFNQMKILIESNNVFSFHENPNAKGVYALQFNPSNTLNASATYPVWLNGEEIMYVSSFARDKAYEEAKQTVEEYESDDLWSDDNKGPADA